MSKLSVRSTVVAKHEEGRRAALSRTTGPMEPARKTRRSAAPLAPHPAREVKSVYDTTVFNYLSGQTRL